MPIGTAFHERTLALCESLNYREWSGFYAVSAYETHPEHEYNAIRNAVALIDVSPLYKYLVTGKDATRLVNRVISRDINRVKIDQVIYCCWCDEQGKVIDDGTITRLGETTYRWTAAEPTLRWIHQNATGLQVEISDVSEDIAALAVQGPLSASLLKQVADAEIASLKYFGVTHGHIAGVSVDISRTGYTGDLGYEIWMPWKQAVQVWDTITEAGKAFDLHPAGMLALDIVRIEAGLILLDVDYTGSKKALIESQKYSPGEIGLGRLVHLEKENFVGRRALAAEKQRGGPARRLVGLEIAWNGVEKLFEAAGLPSQAQSTASRIPVPVYANGKQVGRATSTTWSPTLKKMVALASVAAEHSTNGANLELEFTVEAVRHRTPVQVTPMPFFNPARKTAVVG